MNSVSARRVRLLGSVAAVAAAALVLAGCSGGGSGSSGSTAKAITIGTTDTITSLDPAGSYDNGSFAVMTQVYPFLLDTPYGSPDPKPSIAESAGFTAPNIYEVKLKPGLTFENGDKLTSSDVKFSFDRQLKINDPNGPASLLGNLASVSTPDATTVDFHLKVPNDQTFAQVLTSPAGPIVDEQVFSADKVTPDNTIVKGEAFAGQYYIASYKVNQLIQYKAFKGYKGLLAPAKTPTINVKYYASSDNLKLDIQSGAIDVAYRSLSATDISSLKNDKKVQVIDGPGGEIRYIVFNFNTMPYGAKTSDASPAKALAVRQAAADLVDRQAISQQVYKGTYTPLYSYVPDGLTGATPALKSMYGDGNGGPSLSKAKAVLAAAGVKTPIALNIQYTGDHYGPSSGDEYGLIKSQLESGGLFKVSLQQTEYVQYSKDRVNDLYPAYQLGWFPDYSDADDYLTPFFSANNFLANHYSNPTVQGLLTKEVGDTNKADRTQVIEQVQQDVAKDLSTLPLLQGSSVAVVGSDVHGTTLDASYKFRYATLYK
ncbi:ABC transporter substrate-binding protein [Gryllotalpicola reticulitermitis]|uniref:ABC transporter substrate-binding protein n=1 Tax=Gryllotalpicola reticulitermitis TaxID=1184153 RepID=A0ABV8QAA6_9MICO